MMETVTRFPRAPPVTTLIGTRRSLWRRRGSRRAVRAVRDRCEMTAENRHPLAEAKFLTVAEVAALMRVSKMTVYRLVHSGDLPAVRVGRSFRVPEQAVHDYLRDSFVEAG